MKTSNGVVTLAIVIVILALIAVGVGLFWPDGGSSVPFTTVRGQPVQIYGQGLYRYDSVLIATGFRVADAVTLVLAVPLLIISLVLYRSGSLRGGTLLAGTLSYFLYDYMSVAFGAAYNNLFLVYVALFSASLFALILTLGSFDLASLSAHLSPRAPRNGIGIFLIVSGIVLMLIWLALSILPALLVGKAPPEVEHYTTVITYVVDLGLVAPSLIIAGFLARRRSPWGDLLAPTLLVFTDVLGISLMAGGTVQFLTGQIAIGQFIGFVASFAILTIISIALTLRFFRALSWQRAGSN